MSDVRRLQAAAEAGLLKPGEFLSEISKERAAELLALLDSVEEVERVGREYPDGVHTCAELQRLEPGRRPCTCGRCPQ